MAEAVRPSAGERDERRARQARVNVAAIERNCARLRSELRHGRRCARWSRPTATATAPCRAPARRSPGGASWLAVAGAHEARELREAGLGEVRVLRDGSAQPGRARARRSRPSATWSSGTSAIRGGGRAPPAAGGCTSSSTRGMGRLGTRDPAEAARVAALPPDEPGIELAGVMTHFATADDLEDDGFFAGQLAAFASWARVVKASSPSWCARGQQRGGAARAGGAVRHGALRHRHLRHGPLRRGPRRARRSSRRSS